MRFDFNFNSNSNSNWNYIDGIEVYIISIFDSNIDVRCLRWNCIWELIHGRFLRKVN